MIRIIFFLSMMACSNAAFEGDHDPQDQLDGNQTTETHQQGAQDADDEASRTEANEGLYENDPVAESSTNPEADISREDDMIDPLQDLNPETSETTPEESNSIDPSRENPVAISGSGQGDRSQTKGQFRIIRIDPNGDCLPANTDTKHTDYEGEGTIRTMAGTGECHYLVAVEIPGGTKIDAATFQTAIASSQGLSEVLLYGRFTDPLPQVTPSQVSSRQGHLAIQRQAQFAQNIPESRKALRYSFNNCQSQTSRVVLINLCVEVDPLGPQIPAKVFPVTSMFKFETETSCL